MAAVPLDQFVQPRTVHDLIRRARDEDLGPAGCDLTSQFLAGPPTAAAAIRARKNGTLSGTVLLEMIAGHYSPDLQVKILLEDGSNVQADQTVARVQGPWRAMLAMERVALNFLGHLSGIATLTARYVKAVAGTGTKIYDTRKTTPGWRGLEKYAVVCGGGHAHRMGLYDAILIKDNHLAHLCNQLPVTVNDLTRKARQKDPAPAFVEVEVDSLGQLEQVLSCPIDIVLLDNMAPDTIRQAVTRRNEVAPQVQLEASGGIELEQVASIAASGVDRIAVGAITHSAPVLDVGLDMEKHLGT